MRFALLFAILLTAAGCGYVGDPLPPALNIPQRITDLTAIETGDRIEIEFTLPTLTTEGLVLKTLGGVDLRAGKSPGGAFDADRWADGAKVIEMSSETPGKVRKTLSAKEWAGQEIIVAVRALNKNGRTSGWSNFVTLNVVPPLAKPSLRAASDAEGARIEWTPSAGATKYQLFRKAAGADGDPAQIAEVESGNSYTDKTAEYGAKYVYRLFAWNGAVRSDPSEDLEFSPVDTFPPSVPTALQAIPGVNTVELAWERVTESDLRGYRVYRSVEGAAYERLTDLVDVPSFSDKTPPSGKKCAYVVTALDVRGNESGRSVAVEITTP